MRTTINLDEELLERVICETGEKDRGRAVNAALAEFIRHKKIERLLASRGAFPDLIDRTEEWEEAELKEELARLEQRRADDNS